MTGQRFTDNAIVRLRAAMLDLTAAGRHTDANDVAAIIERIAPPPGSAPSAREARAPMGAPGRQLGPARSEVAAVPVAAAPPTPILEAYATEDFVLGSVEDVWHHDKLVCMNCHEPMAKHCTVHLLPCCPGSLMHGGDEGTWTP